MTWLQHDLAAPLIGALALVVLLVLRALGRNAAPGVECPRPPRRDRRIYAFDDADGETVAYLTAHGMRKYGITFGETGVGLTITVERPGGEVVQTDNHSASNSPPIG